MRAGDNWNGYGSALRAAKSVFGDLGRAGVFAQDYSRLPGTSIEINGVGE